ncbi:translation initiation factor eIF2B subunit delta isoform X2 [Atheta coriaria]
MLMQDQPDTNKLSKKERRKAKVAEKGTINNTDHNKKNTVEPNAKADHATDQIQVKQESVPQEINAPPVSTDAPHEGQKSKAQLRAERREKQEQQRLAKQNNKETVAPKPVMPKSTKKLDDVKQKSVDVKPKTLRKVVEKIDSAKKRHRVQLFSHLEKSVFKPLTVHQAIHPAIIQLGAQYAAKTILGSDARCLALLCALKHLINDFQTPVNQELCRAFEAHLHSNVEHLQLCRPFAVSMTNALRYFKLHLAQIKTSMTDSEKKDEMQTTIDSYVEDEIDKAVVAISAKVCEKINDNDVILTYGHSSLVNKILIDAKEKGRNFKVIIVDARPLLEGRRTLTKLTNAGIECTYILITAINFIIKQATKVIFGAHALLNNGYVMARAGTALVALIAKTHMKPVLVCCETSKFSERAQTDSFVYNEIGDPNELMPIKDKFGYLNALNLMYDVTPPKYVTGVATELGILPCTSVPVILRLKPTE